MKKTVTAKTPTTNKVAKKTASKATRQSGVKSVRRGSKEISPTLAVYATGVADAVKDGAKLGSLAAELSARLAAWKAQEQPEYTSMYAPLELESRVAAFQVKVAAAKTPAKKEKHVKKNAKAPVVALVVDELKARVLDARYHEIMKLACLLPDQLAHETSYQRAHWNVSPKAYKALDEYKDGVRAVKGWPVWLWEIGWLLGDGTSTFHGTSAKPAQGKKGLVLERDAQKREAQRRNGVRYGKEQLGFRADFERNESAGKPCIVPACKQYSRRPFEARGVKGMELADGKVVCRTHGEILIAISRSGLDALTRGMVVSALLDHGIEPDEKLLAVTDKPMHRQAPVRARAVNPKALTAFIAAGAVVSSAPSDNGHGQKCTFCSRPADVLKWAFKVPGNVRPELLELAVGKPVCYLCGAGLYHLGSGKVHMEEQSWDASGIAEWAKAAREIQHFPKRDDRNLPALDSSVTIKAEKIEPPARPMSGNGNGHPPCPIPGCKLVLLKVNPFTSKVAGMEKAVGISFCGVHLKAVAEIVHAKVTAEERAEMVNALLHPHKDDGFEQIMERAEIQGAPEYLEPVMA